MRYQVMAFGEWHDAIEITEPDDIGFRAALYEYEGKKRRGIFGENSTRPAAKPEGVEISTGFAKVGDLVVLNPGHIYRVKAEKIGRYQDLEVWRKERWGESAVSIGWPHDWRHALPADIPSGLPLSDIPEPLRGEVEKQRQASVFTPEQWAAMEAWLKSKMATCPKASVANA